MQAHHPNSFPSRYYWNNRRSSYWYWYWYLNKDGEVVECRQRGGWFACRYFEEADSSSDSEDEQDDENVEDDEERNDD